MDFIGDWLYLIIGIAVVGVLTLIGLLTGRRGKASPGPGTGTDVIAPPTEADVETPTEAPTLEKPEGTASRLVRLRQRLAGS